ncbi:hypothetical protein ACFRQM_42145 [Streptomyces sp. NPDC056831]|uniref:hypothetical protein n=1 Tax=Streptomyces sp. NPDC056831 TaxID=3345954 RepID=UPI0036C31953
MPAPLRLSCCLCLRLIPLAQDVHELDSEWHRRFPDMVGNLACTRCTLHTPWSCQKPGTRTYVDGHIPTARGNCFDAWSHVGRRGTHRAMVLSCPEAALLQGAEPYLRNVATGRGVRRELAATICAVLADWDNRHPAC